MGLRMSANHKSIYKIDPDLMSRVKGCDNIIWACGIPWTNLGIYMEPIVAPHTLTDPLDRNEIQRTLKANHLFFAKWTDQWDKDTPTEWWWTCCDTEDYSIEKVPSESARRNIRQGKKNCTIMRLTPDQVIKDGYSLFYNALKSYKVKEIKLPTKKKFQEKIESAFQFSGYEPWGAYVNDKLAAISTCLVLQNSVSLNETKSDSSLHSFNPNAILFFTLTQYYLTERNIKYVNNGSRTLLHPTNINESLIRLGFRKTYARVNIEMNFSAKMIDKMKPELWGNYLGLPNILGEQWDKIIAFRKITEIARTFKDV